VLSPGDVVAGQIARSYLEADGVQGGAASTVHLAQGRTVEHAIAVLDPHQHAASYVALSRDRSSTTVILSAEAVSNTPEDLAWLQQLPAAQRQSQVLQRYANNLHQAGVLEQARGLLEHTWPELASSSRPRQPLAVVAATPPGPGVGEQDAAQRGPDDPGANQHAGRRRVDLATAAQTSQAAAGTGREVGVDRVGPGQQRDAPRSAQQPAEPVQTGEQEPTGSGPNATGGQPVTSPDFLARLAAAGAEPFRVRRRPSSEPTDPDAQHRQQLARDSVEQHKLGYEPDAPSI